MELVVSLTSFAAELALAWQKLTMYQEGHPERRQAIDRAHAVLTGLIAPTGSLALGVSRDALIGPEGKIVSAPAVRLAEALYRMEAAVLQFDEGLESFELEHLLNLLPRGDSLQETPDLASALKERGVRHVQVTPIDFSAIVATDSLDEPTALPDNGDSTLWDRVLQKVLNDPRFSIDARAFSPEDSPFEMVQAVVGEVLESYGVRSEDLDRLTGKGSVVEVVEMLAALVGEAAGGTLAEADDERARRSCARHVTQLLGALPGGMRQGVLDGAVRELVTRTDGIPGLTSLSGTVSAAGLVGSLRRLRTEGVVFAPRVVAAVENLVSQGVREINRPEEERDPEELATDLRKVFGAEDIDRVSSSGKGLGDRVFVRLRRHVPVHAMFTDLTPYLETLTEERLDVDLSMTMVDLLQRPFLEEEQIGWVIERQREIFKKMLASGRFVSAARIVESVRNLVDSEAIHPVREAAEHCLEGLRSTETLSGLVDILGEVRRSDIRLVHHLIELLGPTAIRQLLYVLGDEPELSRRRHVFDLLVSFGSEVVPPALDLLDDDRWYMVRNIVSLLRQTGEGLSIDILEKMLRHEDNRVRIETVKCIPDLADDVTPEFVERVLEDPDTRVVELAIGIFGSSRIEAAKEPLVRLLKHSSRTGRHRGPRLRAIRALGEIGDPAVLPELAPFFRSWLSTVGTEERQVAFRSLALYPHEARRQWIKKGRLSPDPVVREICRTLDTPGEAS